jgi:uncharacterized protein
LLQQRQVRLRHAECFSRLTLRPALAVSQTARRVYRNVTAFLASLAPTSAEWNLCQPERVSGGDPRRSDLIFPRGRHHDSLHCQGMPSHNFGSFVFTPVVKALQERYGSRRQYAKLEKAAESPDRLGEDERLFIAERDSVYMASVGATGWPYIQHRGGPKGFLKVIDDRTIAFADLSGNKQFISAGNLTTDARVALILVDYPQQARLKILGRAEILEGDHATAWIERVRDPRYKAAVERVFVIHLDAFDWNCPQHITPRYTAEDIQEAIAPVEQELQRLQQENELLRKQLANR